ncbi:DMT family transporter [Corallincola spongiicola]|uniref:DMT family transporter n=1 Tax=Corallincola spongiicola TaxID=2520508 RepID=UPI001FE4C3F4|nr:DMT family transporter [Corallincola spongiicola]
MQAINAKDPARAVLFALTAVLLWSTVATAFKWSLQTLSPAQLVFLAALFSTLFLGIVVGWQKKLHLLFSTFLQRPLQFALLGAINPCLYYWVLFEAYDRLPAQQAQTLNYTWAITLTLLSVPLLKHRVTRPQWLGAALGYFGAVIIATRGDLLALQFDSTLGVLLALTSTLLWSIYWIFNARHQADPVVSLLLCFIIGTPWCAVLAGYQGALWPDDWRGWLGAAYVGLFEMGITFILWLTALRLTDSAARVGNLIFLSPFLSLLFIYGLLGEAIHPATYIGLAFIVCGVLAQQWRRN